MKKLYYLMAFIVLPLILQGETNAQTGWFWQNPLPTGTILQKVSFSDPNNGYILGYARTLLHTSDGGTNWSAKSIGASGFVHTFDSLTAIVGGGFGKILKTTNAGQTWNEITVNYNGPLIDVSFCDDNNGMIVTGSSTLLSTTNAGNDWTVFTNNVFRPFKRISMVNTNTATAITGDNAEIYRTTDGGLTWQDQTVSTFDDLEDVYFIDTDNGYAVGSYGMILHTIDGGINWNWQPVSTSNYLYSVSFSDENNGIAVGEGCVLLYTSDGGINWILQNSGLPYCSILYGVDLINSNTAIAVGYNGVILKTTNAGSNWLNLSTSGIYNAHFYGVHFSDQNYGTAVGALGVIWHTANGGNEWVPQTSGTTEDLYDVYFRDSNNGLCVGPNGAMLITSNGGLDWTIKNSGTTNYLYSIFFFDTNIGFISGMGVVLKTTDGGENWSIFGNAPPHPLYDICFTDLNIGYAVSWQSQKVFKTTDGGLNWFKSIAGIIGYDDFAAVDFIDSDTGVIVGGNDKIYRTTNGGTNWVSISSPSASDYKDILFVTSNLGYAVGRYGVVIHTTDGGSTWQQQNSFTTNDLYALSFLNPYTGNVVGEMGTILKTINGGGFFPITTLINNVTAGSQTIPVETNNGFNINDQIIINPGGSNEESNTITGFGSIILKTPLLFDHSAGEPIIAINITSTEDEIGELFPEAFKLLQNYPNPFNPNTKISWQSPVGSHQTIKVFDVLGNEIATLVDEYKPAGSYNVEFTINNLPAGRQGFQLSSGVYFYQLRAGDYTSVKKMILLK